MAENIVKIDARSTLVSKKKVCAYARVSSGKDAMLHSLSAQVSHYSSFIQQHPDWIYVGVYADEAVTGTLEERPNFQRMLVDARAGKIDIIITKSVSRFARNTVTLLEATRELKELGIDVYFETTKIHTLSSEGELMLALLAGFAQEESRSVSENMRVRIKHDFEQGVIWGGKDALGYKLVRKKMVVVPEEAAIVRKIYNLYLQGNGVVAIAKILRDNNVPTQRGGRWQKSTIESIISNYNYTGDLILQKTFRPDHITKKEKINNGEVNKYLVEDDHEAIILKEIFLKVQEERERRTERYKLNQHKCLNRYPLSGKIKCDCCGKYYRHRKNKYNELWLCQTFDQYGKEYCQSKQIPQSVIYKAFNEIINLKEFDENKFNLLVDFIVAKSGNILEFHFKDGNIQDVQWKDVSRKDSWTPEMKELARQRAYRNNQKRGVDGKWQK